MLDLELHLEFLASSAKIESLGKAQCGEDESLAHLLCIQETKWEHKKIKILKIVWSSLVLGQSNCQHLVLH